MKMSVARQLALLAAALTFLVLLIGSLAFVSWREIRDLRSALTPAQLQSFRIADQLQTRLRNLGSKLRKYEEGGRPEDWRSFEDESRQLDAWLMTQRSARWSYMTIASPSLRASHGPPNPVQMVLVSAGP